MANNFMFNKQDDKTEIKDAETIIGPSVKVKGDFNGEGNIVIDGALEGSLKTAKSLLIGDRARVAANIEAGDAKINGEVLGNINVADHLEIGGSAKITGDINTNSISISRGAIINGKLSMNNSGKTDNQ